MNCDSPFLSLRHHLGFLLKSTQHTIDCIEETLLVHPILLSPGSDERSFVADIGDIRSRESRRLPCKQLHIHRLIDFDWFEMHIEYLLPFLEIREFDGDLAVETPSPEKRLIEDVGTVGCGHDDDTRVGSKSVHLSEELVECAFALIVRLDACLSASGPTDGINLIDEDDARCFGLRLIEEVSHPRRSYSHKHLDEVGS